MNRLEYLIKKELDRYVGFDSDLIFKGNYHTLLFGGFIRDILSGLEPSDVDLCTIKGGTKEITILLKQNGWSMDFDYTKRLVDRLYKNLNNSRPVINEPYTFVKGNKKIQLIRPIYDYRSSNINIVLADFISNVDISICGFSYDGNILTEYIEGAYSDLVSKKYRVNKKATMYHSDNIEHRIKKMNEKGFKQITDVKKYNRSLLINRLNENLEINRYINYTIIDLSYEENDCDEFFI